MAKAVRRSTTFKQFLLRVHPDHFRAIPKVHEENLQSIQLLNQFMDEQHAFASNHRERKRVFFSAYVPAPRPTDARELKRFRLDLATNIEDHMERILRECGVEIPATERATRPAPESSTHRATWDVDYERYPQRRPINSMDFGSDADFGAYAHTRRRKRPIMTLREFLAFMDEPATRQKQQHVRTAHESIQSVKRSLVREFGLQEVATSCGWASIPLNATLMSLLQTLRKLQRSATGITLDKVRLDMRADASEIDYFDEYTIVLNVADVPLQWVEVLEQVDAEMLAVIHAARASLEHLQHAAERALRGAMTIERGRTCSALAYRGFLQDMAAVAPVFTNDPVRADTFQDDHAVVEQIAIVIEDSVRDCEILDDGKVRAPSCGSAAHVLEFIDTHRVEIHDQVMEYDAQRKNFEILAGQCTSVLGLASLTYAETLRLREVNQACSKLLAFATDENRYGSASATERLQAAHKKALRFDLYFGLAQDGVFTLPTEWL